MHALAGQSSVKIGSQKKSVYLSGDFKINKIEVYIKKKKKGVGNAVFASR